MISVFNFNDNLSLIGICAYDDDDDFKIMESASLFETFRFQGFMFSLVLDLKL